MSKISGEDFLPFRQVILETASVATIADFVKIPLATLETIGLSPKQKLIFINAVGC